MPSVDAEQLGEEDVPLTRPSHVPLTRPPPGPHLSHLPAGWCLVHGAAQLVLLPAPTSPVLQVWCGEGGLWGAEVPQGAWGGLWGSLGQVCWGENTKICSFTKKSHT